SDAGSFPSHGQYSLATMPIIVPPRGTRGSKVPRLPGPLMNGMQGLFHLIYRIFGEWMRIQGRPLVELETIGARSGARRRTVLGSFPDPFAEPAPSAAAAMNSRSSWHQMPVRPAIRPGS